jgi:hypothetical protein
MNQIIAIYWNNPLVDKHRRGLSDGEWGSMQDKKNLYYLGDIVSFKVGGMGIITDVSTPHPRSYSCTKITGKPFHKDGKCSWHLVGDFKKLLYPSGIRSILCSHS